MTRLHAAIALCILTAVFLSSCSDNPLDANSQPDPYGYWEYTGGKIVYDDGTMFDYGNCNSQGHLKLNSDGTWSETRNFDGLFFPVGGDFTYTESTGEIIFKYNDGTVFESGSMTIGPSGDGTSDRIMRMAIISHKGYRSDYMLIKRVN